MKEWKSAVIIVALVALMALVFLSSSLFGFLHLSPQTRMTMHGIATLIMIGLPLVFVFSIKKDGQDK